jgi:hemolysin activation/secretion protein
VTSFLGRAAAALVGVALGAVTGLGGAAHAQQLPGSVTPGQIERQFQTLPEPRATEEPIVTPGLEPEKPPSGAENVHFTLSGIVVEGSTVFTQADFAPLYQPLLGKDVTLAQIYGVAAAITAKYGKAGYTLSVALVPAQRISTGVVHIQVVEGYVDQIFIKTEDGTDITQPQLRAYLEKIAAVRPLRQADLERYLLLANDLPGVQARAVLAPSETPGASNLTLIVNQKKFDGYANFDNRGSQFIGPYQGTFAASANNVLGLSEQTGFRFINTIPGSNLHYWEVNHQEQIGHEGTRANFIGLVSLAQPGSSLAQNGIQSTNYTGSAQIYHPFIRSRAENLSAGGRFDIEQLDSTSFGQALTSDRLRVLRGAVNYDFVDAPFSLVAVNLLAVELSQGLGIFGATGANTPNVSRPGMSSNFTKMTFDASRNQALVDKFGIQVAARGQVAFQTLPASEEFGFGGPQFGRGYDPSEIIGDHGIEGKAELQYTDQDCLKGWVRTCQPYAFVDAGSVWNISTTAGQPVSQAGVSVGAGVRGNLNDHLSGYIEIDVPLIVLYSPQQSSGARVFFSLLVPF